MVATAQVVNGQEVIAKLVYVDSGILPKSWIAYVTMAQREMVVSAGYTGKAYQLYICHGSSPITPAGVFQNAKALEKYVRGKIPVWAEGTIPEVDTLDKLSQGRLGDSVVPVCFATVGYNTQDGCITCPYSKACGESVQVEEALQQAVPQLKEPESVLIERLQKKVKEQWGKKC